MVECRRVEPWREGGPRKAVLIPKDHLQGQERCIPTNRKTGKNARRPVWMNKELLDKHKKEAYRG